MFGFHLFCPVAHLDVPYFSEAATVLSSCHFRPGWVVFDKHYLYFYFYYGFIFVLIFSFYYFLFAIFFFFLLIRCQRELTLYQWSGFLCELVRKHQQSLHIIGFMHMPISGIGVAPLSPEWCAISATTFGLTSVAGAARHLCDKMVAYFVLGGWYALD